MNKKSGGGRKKETHKLNTDVEVKYRKMAEELADGRRYRNLTHVVEAAIELLYEKEKKGEG